MFAPRSLVLEFLPSRMLVTVFELETERLEHELAFLMGL